MKKLSWDEYYEHFADWSFNTQKSYSYNLTDFGISDEVYEVIAEFIFQDKNFASSFAEKALLSGVRFSTEHVLELASEINKSVLSKMAEQTSDVFTREQLEELYMMIDDSTYESLLKKQGLSFSDDDLNEPDDLEDECEEKPSKKLGFWSTLFAVLVGIDVLNDIKRNKDEGYKSR